MKEIRINVPLELRQTILYPTAVGFTSRVETRHGQVDVTIFGLQKDVDDFLAPNEQKTGLDDGPWLSTCRDPESPWCEHVDAAEKQWKLATGTNCSDAAKATIERLREWETIMKQRGWNSPSDFRAFTAHDFFELQEWRSAARLFDVGSPKELASITNVSFGELLERKIGRAWRDETGQETPELAGKRIASLVNDVHSLTQRVGALLDERTKWREKTNCDHPSEFDGEMVHLRKTRNEMDREIRAWKKAVGCDSVCDYQERKRINIANSVQREQAWVDATGHKCPGDAEQRIEDLELKIEDLEKDASLLNRAIEQNKQHLAEWQLYSGVSSPDELVEKFRVTEDAWKEATGAADTHSAYKKIADLESRLLSYASEIDALRKVAQATKPTEVEVELDHGTPLTANGKTIGIVHNPERELLKVRAELQSKCREAQTEKERADENAREMVKRGALLDKITEALGCDFNHDSLPEHVADLKHAYDNINDSLVGPDDLANETKEIDTIIWAHVKSTGVASAASSIAGRSVHLSASWAKTMQAREILGAKSCESIVDAANHVMDRLGTAERASSLLETGVVEARKAAGIDHEKPGSGNYTSLAEWCSNARATLASAIIPLPKPEKVKPGQKWAVVSNVGYVYGSATGNYPVDLSSVGIVPEKQMIESGSWIFLGT